MEFKVKAAIFYLLIILNLSHPSPIIENRKKDVISHLQSIGHHPRNKSMESKTSHKQLRHLKIFNHISETDKDDKSSRFVHFCGVPNDVKGLKRRKRYDLLSAKWEKHHITWNFDCKFSRFCHESGKIRRITKEALNVWSRNSILSFQEVSEPYAADIVISFEAPIHSEVDQFPMLHDVLAHAFRPGQDLGGDVHLREDIEWDFDVMYDEQPSKEVKSFFAIILHELGHSIGLAHSEVRDSVMYYSYSKSTGVLSPDDIEGIQHIYGVPRTNVQRPATTPTTTLLPWEDNQDNDFEADKIPEKCETTYDAIAMIRNEMFIFKGIYLWRPDYNSDAIEIRKIWRLPESFTHVDSVYEKDDGMIWFFVGRDIYVFSGTTLAYKTSLSHLGIDHHFEKIDAIFKWNYNKKTYIFINDQYWKLNGKVVDHNYPKDILRSWRDVYDINTAFSDEENLYFFKGTSFYHFNPRTMRINRMKPQSAAEKFMKCPMQPRRFQLDSRFGSENPDVIDEEQTMEFPEDEDNIEKLEAEANTDEIENTLDDNDASKNYFIYPVFLASLAVSRVLQSILLRL